MPVLSTVATSVSFSATTPSWMSITKESGSSKEGTTPRRVGDISPRTPAHSQL